MALELAHRLNVGAIIDDGILIAQGRKLAGTSAKYERTKIQAVKRAIFYYRDHAEEVKRSLRQLMPERLLILGTSQRMIQRIVAALQLSGEIEYIPIESVKPLPAIKTAQFIRQTQGKHVIPMPRVEVEKDFLQKLIASAQKILSPKKEVIGESTIVHPPFAGGRIQIHEQVLRKIAQTACLRFPEVVRVHKMHFAIDDLPRIQVAVSLRVAYGTVLPPLLSRIQEALYDAFDFALELAPASIDIQLLSLQLTGRGQA